MAVNSTVMVITSTDSTYTIPGDWNTSALVSNYSASVPGLAGFSASESIATGVDGDVRTVTFSPRTGNKGSIIQKCKNMFFRAKFAFRLSKNS